MVSPSVKSLVTGIGGVDHGVMTNPAVIRRAAAVAGAAAGFVLFRRWRRTAAAGRRGPEDSGGTAGVREPRNPVPPTLVDAGAAEPSG